MGKRKKVRVIKRGLKFKGWTASGDPVCVDKQGRIIYGDGCLEASVSEDGKIQLTIDYDKCTARSPAATKIMREQIERAARKGATVNFTFKGTPAD